MSETGKARRLARMFNARSGRMLCLAFDHGMQVGTVPGTEDPARVLDAAAEAGVDAVILNPGMMVRHGHRLAGGPAVVLRIDQTTMWRHGTPSGYPDTHNRLVSSVEEAVSMGAEAVITYLFTCNNRPEEETRSFEICGAVASACRKWGVVHVIEAMAAKGGFARHDDPDVISLNCRMAGEIGADIIKTDWCADKDRFAAIATQSLAPIAIAGGPARAGTEAVADYARGVIASGAKGLMFGRNVFEQDDMKATLRLLRGIVHG
jgi:DhnA family fructose-bisphosphate aldolase class Ia